MPDLVLCVPVELAPDWETPYSTYKKAPCPDCGKEMWLGALTEGMVLAGLSKAVCMFCARDKYHIGKEDLSRVQILAGRKAEEKDKHDA